MAGIREHGESKGCFDMLHSSSRASLMRESEVLGPLMDAQAEDAPPIKVPAPFGTCSQLQVHLTSATTPRFLHACTGGMQPHRVAGYAGPAEAAREWCALALRGACIHAIRICMPFLLSLHRLQKVLWTSLLAHRCRVPLFVNVALHAECLYATTTLLLRDHVVTNARLWQVNG